jgi:hypothetical protein
MEKGRALNETEVEHIVPLINREYL